MEQGLHQNDLSSRSLRRIRFRAKNAKTFTQCGACMVYGNKCSEYRPCTRCIKLSRPCLRTVQWTSSERSVFIERPIVQSSTTLQINYSSLPSITCEIKWAKQVLSRTLQLGYRIDRISQSLASLTLEQHNHISAAMTLASSAAATQAARPRGQRCGSFNAATAIAVQQRAVADMGFGAWEADDRSPAPRKAFPITRNTSPSRRRRCPRILRISSSESHQILFTLHIAEYMTIVRHAIVYTHDDFAQGGLPVARLRPGHRPPRRGPLQPAPGEPSHDCWCEPWCKTLRKGEHTHTHTHTNINNIYIYIYIYIEI